MSTPASTKSPTCGDTGKLHGFLFLFSNFYMGGTLRFGVAGTNSITRWFLDGAMHDPRFSLTAVCSRSLDRARQFAAAYGGRAMPFRSIEEMAGSSDVDAVYIAVPNSLHAQYATACMNAGKHVLLEKPAASNAAEMRSLMECAKSNGVALMEAMLPTASPNFSIILDNLGRLGTLRRYFAAYCQYSSRYDRLKSGDVANVFSPQMSGGATMDIGVYTLYPMVALLGMPSGISAHGTLLPSGVDGQATAVMQYPGFQATVMYSKIADSYLPTEIEGERGNLLMSAIHLIHDVTYIPHRAPMSGQGPEAERQSIGTQLEFSDYYYETKEFIDVVLTGRQQSRNNSWQNSLNTLCVTDEIRRQLGVVFPADGITV